MVDYYIDTCIWLNLFKKEGDASKGKPYWRIAEEFLKIVESFGDKIYYSGFILNELEHKLSKKEYKVKRKLLIKRYNKVKSITEDISLARRLESEWEYEIGFYDCVHVAICKRLKMALVTRDKALINASKKYIRVAKPENL